MVMPSTWQDQQTGQAKHCQDPQTDQAKQRTRPNDSELCMKWFLWCRRNWAVQNQVVTVAYILPRDKWMKKIIWIWRWIMMITLFNQQVQNNKYFFLNFFQCIFKLYKPVILFINFMEWCKEFGLLYINSVLYLLFILNIPLVPMHTLM